MHPTGMHTCGDNFLLPSANEVAKSCKSSCWDTPLLGRHPPGRHSLGRHPPGRHPLGRHPPQADSPGQAPLPGQTASAQCMLRYTCENITFANFAGGKNTKESWIFTLSECSISSQSSTTGWLFAWSSVFFFIFHRFRDSSSRLISQVDHLLRHIEANLWQESVSWIFAAVDFPCYSNRNFDLNL